MNDFLNHFNLNVDLAIEARDIVRGTANVEISGVEEIVDEMDNIKVTTINIMNEQASQVMGRPVGSYITIESPPLKINDPYVKEEIIEAMSKSLTNMVNLNPNDTVLLIGLGNWRATADALGPKFIEYSPITRHYHQYAPQALVEGMRPSCGIAPGVLGITGLETFEVVKGVVEKVNPAIVVVVDALAAQNVDRIGTTIQITNTGIQPGAGVGNNRHVLNQEGLGVPVIAIGCPTIVNAAIIANQSIKNFCLDSGAMFNETQATNAIRTTLSYFGGSLSVTPKEIDDIIENASRTMAMGVAHFLFPSISTEQLELYAT